MARDHGSTEALFPITTRSFFYDCQREKSQSPSTINCLTDLYHSSFSLSVALEKKNAINHVSGTYAEWVQGMASHLWSNPLLRVLIMWRDWNSLTKDFKAQERFLLRLTAKKSFPPFFLALTHWCEKTTITQIDFLWMPGKKQTMT